MSKAGNKPSGASASTVSGAAALAVATTAAVTPPPAVLRTPPVAAMTGSCGNAGGHVQVPLPAVQLDGGGSGSAITAAMLGPGLLLGAQAPTDYLRDRRRRQQVVTSALGDALTQQCPSGDVTKPAANINTSKSGQRVITSAGPIAGQPGTVSESTDGSSASSLYGLEGVLPRVHRSFISALVGADPLVIEAAQRYASALQLATLSGAKRLQNLLQLIDCSSGGGSGGSSGQQQGGNHNRLTTASSSSSFLRNATGQAAAASTAVDLLAASASFSFNAMNTSSSVTAGAGGGNTSTSSSLLVLAARRQLDAIVSAVGGNAHSASANQQTSDATATGTALLRRLTLLQSLLQRVFDVACTFSTAWQQQQPQPQQQQGDGTAKEQQHCCVNNKNNTAFQVESNILLQTIAINQLAFAGDDERNEEASSSAASAASSAFCAVALLSPPIRRALAVCRERLTHLVAAYYAAAASGRVLVASSPLRLTSDAALQSTRPLMTPAAFTGRAWAVIEQALTTNNNTGGTAPTTSGAKVSTNAVASSTAATAAAAVWRTRLQLSQVLAGRHSGGAVVSRSELVALRRWMARFAGLLTTIAQQQQQSQQQGGEGGPRRGGAGGRLQALQAAASITSPAQLSTVFVTGALAAHTAAAVTAAGGRRPRGTAFSDSSSSGEEDNTSSTTTATSPSLLQQQQQGATSPTADAMMLGGEEGLLKRSGLFCPATSSPTQPSVLCMTNNMNAPLLQPLCVMPAIPNPSMSESVASVTSITPQSNSNNATSMLKMTPSSALFDKMTSTKGRDNYIGEGAGDREENGPLFPVFGGGAASKQSSVSAAATVAALVALTAAASGAAFTCGAASASSQQHPPKTPPGLAGMLLDLLAPLVPTSSSASGSGDAAAATPPVSSSTSNAQASSSVPHPTPAQLLELLGEAYGGLATKLLAPDLFSQATAGIPKSTTAANAVGGHKSQQRGGGAPLSPSAAQLDGPDVTTAGGGEGANEDGGGDDTSTNNNNTQKATATRRMGPAAASSAATSSSGGAAATFLADHSAFLSGQYAMTLSGITAGALEVTEACVVVPPILAGALFGSNAASPISSTTTATATHLHKSGITGTGGATTTTNTTAATPIVGGSSSGEGVWAASASPFSTEGLISRLLLTPAFAEMYHAEVRRQGTSSTTTSSGATGSSMTTSTSPPPPPPQPVVSDLSSKAAQQLYQQQLLQITQSVREVLQPLLEQPHSSTLQPPPALPASASPVSGSSGGGGQPAAGGGAGSGKVGKTSSTTAGTRHTSTTSVNASSSSKGPRQATQRPPSEVLAVQHQLQGEWRRWWAHLEGRDEQVRWGVVRLQTVFEEAVEGLRQREQERLAAAHNAALADLQRRYEEQQQQALLAKQQQQAAASLAAAALQAQSSFSLSTALGGPQLPPRQPSQQLHSPSKQRSGGGGGKGKDNKDADDPNALEPAVAAHLLEAHTERVQGQEAHFAAMALAVDSLVDTLSDAAHAALSSTELPTEQHMLSDALKALAEEVMTQATLTLSLRSNNNGSSPLGSPQQANLSGPNSARGGGDVLPHSARGSKGNNKGAGGGVGGKRGGGGGPLDGSSGAAGDDGAIDDAIMSPAEAAGSSSGGGGGADGAASAAAAAKSSNKQQQSAPSAANAAGGGAPRKGGGKGGATNDGKDTPPQPPAGLQPPPFVWDMAAARRVLRRMLQQSPLLTTPPSSASADQPQQQQTQTQSSDPANATNTTANTMLLQLVAGDVARATWGLGRLTAAAGTLLQLGLFGDHPSRHHALQKEGDVHDQDEQDDDEGTDGHACSKSGAGWRRCDRFMADLLVNTTTSTSIVKKDNDHPYALYGPVRVGVASQTALDGRLLTLCGGPRLLGHAYADLLASPVTTTSTSTTTTAGVVLTDGIPPLLRRLSMLLSCWYAAAGSHAAAGGTSTNGHLPPLALQHFLQHQQQPNTNNPNNAAATSTCSASVDSASLPLWFGASSGTGGLPLFQAMGLYLGLSLPPPAPLSPAGTAPTAAAVPPPNPLVLSPLAAHRGVCCCSGSSVGSTPGLSSGSFAGCPFCALVARRSTTSAGGQRLVTPLPIVRYDIPVPARDGSPSTMTVTLAPSMRSSAASFSRDKSSSSSGNSIMVYARALRSADLALRRHACLPAYRFGSTNPCPVNAVTTMARSSNPGSSSCALVVGNTVGAGGGCYPPWESFSPANAANAANRRLLASTSSSSVTPTRPITAAALAESTTATESTTTATTSLLLAPPPKGGYSDATNTTTAPAIPASDTALLLAPKALSLDKCVAAAVSEITTTTTSTTSTASTNTSTGRGRRSSCGLRRRGRSGCGSDDDDDKHGEEHQPPHAPAVLSVAMGNLPSSMAVSAAAATTAAATTTSPAPASSSPSSLLSPPSPSSASFTFTPLVASLLLAGTTETCWYRYEPFTTTATDKRPDPSSASATTVEGEVRLPPPTPALLNIVAMIDALTGIIGNGRGGGGQLQNEKASSSVAASSSINSKVSSSAVPPATSTTTTTTTPIAVVIDVGCDGANYITLTHLLRDVGLVLAARQRLYTAQQQQLQEQQPHQQEHSLPPSVRVAVLFDLRPLVMLGPMLGGTERCRRVVSVTSGSAAAAVLEGGVGLGSTMPSSSSCPIVDDGGGGAVSRSNSSSIGRSGGGGASALPPTSPYTPRGGGGTTHRSSSSGPSTAPTADNAALVVLDRTAVATAHNTGRSSSSTVTVAAGHGSLLATCGIAGPLGGVVTAGGTPAAAATAAMGAPMSGHAADMRQHSEKQAAVSSNTTASIQNNKNNNCATATSMASTTISASASSNPSSSCCDGGPSPAGFWLHLATWLGIDGVLLPPPTSGHANAAYNELSRIHEAVTALHHGTTGPALDAAVNVADACCYIAPA